MMWRRHFLSLLGGAAVGACAGCSKTNEPADPIWGKEPCAYCAMIVSDKRFAGQVLAGGDRKFFDDIGCMVLWLEEHGGRPVDRIWARDATMTSRWLDAKSARYADGAKTPMDFGFEARPNDAVVGWNEMRDRVIAKKRGRDSP